MEWSGLSAAAALHAFLISFSLLQEVRADEIGAEGPKPACPSVNEQDMEGLSTRKAVAHLGEVREYLWEVYQRAPVKCDRTGDFTWKDPQAAKRLGLSMPDYVIGGMDPDFREQLYHAGKAMDAAGIRWTILSAFRDDYRQSLAAGYKAGVGNSLHGGSTRTGGYGHGRAVDVASEEEDVEAVWKWFDSHGAKFGLHRPMNRRRACPVAGRMAQACGLVASGAHQKYSGKSARKHALKDADGENQTVRQRFAVNLFFLVEWTAGKGSRIIVIERKGR